MTEIQTNSLLIMLALLLSTGVMFGVSHFKKFPIPETFGLKPIPGKEIVKWVLLFLPIFAVFEFIYFYFEQNTTVWDHDPLTTTIKILSLAFIGPVVEELVLRGLLFTKIKGTRLGSIGAILITSILFTVMHYGAPIDDLVYFLVIGLYWGWVRHKTDSIIIPVILHVLVNAVAVIEFMFIN